MSEEEKGLSYVGPINATYRELKESQQSSLTKAITLGHLLNSAKEAVGHGKWAAWLKKHCSEISQRTANVYMNLAKHKEKFIDDSRATANSQRAANFVVSEDLSIREAIERVNKADGGGLETKKEGAPRAPKAGASPRSPGLTELIKTEGVDAIKTALKQAEKFDHVVPRLEDQLKNTSPMRLATVLVQVWDGDALKALVKDLTDQLAKSAATLPRPTSLRPPQTEARPS
jgi:hypothetical protein